MAAQHRWIMLGALMGLIVVVLYNVIKRQY